MSASLGQSAPAVNPVDRYYTFGSAVVVCAPELDAEGRDPASPMARLYNGRVGIIVGGARCYREPRPRMLYSVAISGQVNVRLYACELRPLCANDGTVVP